MKIETNLEIKESEELEAAIAKELEIEDPTLEEAEAKIKEGEKEKG